MIKRKAHIFHTEVSLQEHLDQMGDDETLAQYTVYDGTHYIITEYEMTKKEATQFKIKQLEKQLDECNRHYEHRIKSCDSSIHMYNQALNHEMTNAYMLRREHVIEEYNKEQIRLTKELDKLKYPDYIGFIE